MKAIELNREQLLAFGKQWGWTVLSTLLVLLIGWQGLTIRQQQTSWKALRAKVDSATTLGDELAGTLLPEHEDRSTRQVSKTFFFQEGDSYTLTAITGDKAIINDKELAVGGTIGKATVTEIGVNKVTLKEEDNAESVVLDLHQGI